MFEKLREFFLGEQTELTVDRSGFPTDEETQLATVVLLLESAKADAEVSEHEAQVLCELTSQAFGIPREKLPDLVRMAVSASQNSEKRSYFFGVLNKHFNTRQRQKVFAMAYKIMQADGKVIGNEQSYIAQIRSRLGLSDEETREVIREEASQGAA